MATTVQHPAFPEDTLTVRDPEPWVAQGWIKLSSKEASLSNLNDAPPVTPELPARSASFDAWAEYARSQGATPEQLAEATRDQLRDQYTPPTAV